jgi:dihydrofolate reductase
MNAIVAVDQNWAIGYKDSLLVSIPNDHKFFRSVTMGKVVVLGRKTLAGFPNGLPLAGRTNIILSRNSNFTVKGGIVVHSKEELLQELTKYNQDDIYIIGGGTVYEMMLPYCKIIHVTKIDYAYQADTYFPNLDRLDNWQIIDESEEETYFDIEYQFLKYQNRTPLLYNESLL